MTDVLAYFIVPWLVSTAIVVVGAGVVWSFVRDRRRRLGERGKRRSPAAAFVGAMLFLLGVAMLRTAPAPGERRRLLDGVLRTHADRVVRFVVLAGPRDGKEHPLTRSAVMIDDPTRVRQIVEALRASRDVSLNHPRTRWTARVQMVTTDGTYRFGVNAPAPGDPHGTLVHFTSGPEGGGWNLGTVRADGLDQLLEDAATTAGAR